MKMTAQEKHGLKNLTAKPAKRPKTATMRVRIHYKSQGGEYLCCDSDPLTSYKADQLIDQLTGNSYSTARLIRPKPGFPSDVVFVERVGAYSAASQQGRLVTLPHQMSNQTELMLDEAA